MYGALLIHQEKKQVKEVRIHGRLISLVKGDVYVADQFGAHRNGPTIGDNVGNAIYAKTGNGIVYDGALRDMEGLEEIGGFTSYYTSYDPSYHNHSRRSKHHDCRY